MLQVAGFRKLCTQKGLETVGGSRAKGKSQAAGVREPCRQQGLGIVAETARFKERCWQHGFGNVAGSRV